MLQPGDTIVVEGGQTVRLEKPLKGGRGGEGVVFDVSVRNLVAKIYHNPPGPELVAKLTCMIANPPDDPERASGHAEIAWPLALAMHSGKIVGFLMPKAPMGRQLVGLLNPKTRKEWMPQFTWQGMLLAARNVADAFQHVHAKGYVVGDVKPENIHVTEQSLITILDTDSFQVYDEQKGVIYPCGVATPGYTAPELLQGSLRGQPRRPEQDAFALGVIIFKLLAATNAHPYQGMWVGMGDAPDSDDELVLNGWYTFRAGSLMRPNPRIMPPSAFPPDVVALWERCFVLGHASPSSRPAAKEWFKVLDRIVNSNDILARCADVPWHIHVRDIPCPWCALAKTQGVSYFPGPLPSPQPVPPAVVPAPKMVANRRAPIVPPPPPWPPPQPQFKMSPQPGGAAQPPQPVSADIFTTSADDRSSGRRRIVARAGIMFMVLMLAGVAIYAARRGSPVATSHIPSVPSPSSARKIGDVWENSIGMYLAYIPTGDFVMGSPDGHGAKDEHPQRHVNLTHPMLMGISEVTQRQYLEVMKKNPSFLKGSMDLPVEQVSWEDAREFCRRLGDLDHRSYRLPTEAEWEYACRAGSAEPDGGVSHLNQNGWYGRNSDNKTHEVRTRPANAWGLYDMQGNVWEWCEDVYGDYTDSEEHDPTGPVASTQPTVSPEKAARQPHVARGGSWYDDPARCTAAARLNLAPNTRLNYVGFRVVLENPGSR